MADGKKDEKLRIGTKAYGIVEIAETDVLHFPEGIFAFEEFKSFVLLRKEAESIFSWLQSVEDEKLAFLVMEPAALMPDYVPVISEEQLTLIGAGSSGEAVTFCILTIPAGEPEKMTANLQGPVIINLKKNLGGQFISNDERHSVRTPVFETARKSETA